MKRAISATLGVAALLAVPATAAADSVIVKYRAARGEVAHRGDAARGRRRASSARWRRPARRSSRWPATPAAAAATLSRSATVEYAEPNLELRALATPNDARFGELYGLNNANDADMDAPEGWDAAGLGGFPASGGVKVGIVDTGIDQNHEDLAGKTVDCASCRSCSPTACARAAAPTRTTTARTSPARSRPRPTTASASRASPSTRSSRSAGRSTRAGSGTTAGVANCITYLAGKGVKMISMSLGGGASTTLQTAVRNADQRQRLADHRRGRQRRRRDAQLPGRLRRGRLGRRDRRQRRARLVLERQRRRRDRRRGRRRALDQARRRLRGLLRHLDGDPARGRRGRADRRQEPGASRPRRSAPSSTPRSTTSAPRAATRSSASAA